MAMKQSHDLVSKFPPERLSREHGYRTLSSGKVFHGYHNNSVHNDYPWSWSEKPFQATDTDVKNMSFRLVPEVRLDTSHCVSSRYPPNLPTLRLPT